MKSLNITFTADASEEVEVEGFGHPIALAYYAGMTEDVPEAIAAACITKGWAVENKTATTAEKTKPKGK